ncbi:hypothetical protein V6N13_054707 [Hibiscus sabdariffa]|uniref:C2H2-type domain-containing protein n=1 Tax=Hibiscus sabdariffa TaxID=183260 RepID=A0ABR2DWZ8_9ROSI
MNFSRHNSFSSAGFSLGNGTTGSRFSPSSINSNLGLTSHTVHVHVHTHTVINYVPWPAFPLSEVTPTGTDLLRTSRLLSPTSTMGLAFGSSSRFGSNANHEIFPTQPYPNDNQFLNMILSRSTNQGSVNPTDVRSDVVRETTGLGSDGWTTHSLRGSSSRFGSNANREIFPTQPNPNDNQFMNMDLLRSTNPGSENPTDVRSDVERETTGLRCDGRIHSLRGYPRGIYRCPKCSTTCYSPQSFAAHVQSAHYTQEDEEERRRRMAARCRRRNLRLRRSSHGLTAVPVSSRGVAKGHAERRENGTAVGVDDAHRVRNGVGAAAAAMGGPFSAVVKEEPM